MHGIAGEIGELGRKQTEHLRGDAVLADQFGAEHAGVVGTQRSPNAGLQQPRQGMRLDVGDAPVRTLEVGHTFKVIWCSAR